MRTPSHILFVVCFVLVSLAGCGGGDGHREPNSSAVGEYRLVSVGGLTTTPQVLFEGPVISRGGGISPDGRALLGSSSLGTSGNDSRPILFMGGSLQALGGSGGSASDANASGQIVGQAGGTAFLYENGATKSLGTLGGSGSQALAINSSGQIVGQSFVGSTVRGFLYENGAMRDLGTLGGNASFARDINTSGQVVGGANVDSSKSLAFLYENGTMKGIGTLGGSSSSAYGINDSGQIVGGSDLPGGDFLTGHAFLYADGTMKDLGTLGGTMSSARAINASGQIVGTSKPAGDAAVHAFLYSDGRMRDLNNLLDATGSGWTITDVQGIADDGSISATASKDGIFYAVLLTPIK